MATQQQIEQRGQSPSKKERIAWVPPLANRAGKVVEKPKVRKERRNSQQAKQKEMLRSMDLVVDDGSGFLTPRRKRVDSPDEDTVLPEESGSVSAIPYCKLVPDSIEAAEDFPEEEFPNKLFGKSMSTLTTEAMTKTIGEESLFTSPRPKSAQEDLVSPRRTVRPARNELFASPGPVDLFVKGSEDPSMDLISPLLEPSPLGASKKKVSPVQVLKQTIRERKDSIASSKSGSGDSEEGFSNFYIPGITGPSRSTKETIHSRDFVPQTPPTRQRSEPNSIASNFTPTLERSARGNKNLISPPKATGASQKMHRRRSDMGGLPLPSLARPSPIRKANRRRSDSGVVDTTCSLGQALHPPSPVKASSRKEGRRRSASVGRRRMTEELTKTLNTKFPVKPSSLRRERRRKSDGLRRKQVEEELSQTLSISSPVKPSTLRRMSRQTSASTGVASCPVVDWERPSSTLAKPRVARRADRRKSDSAGRTQTPTDFTETLPNDPPTPAARHRKRRPTPIKRRQRSNTTRQSKKEYGNELSLNRTPSTSTRTRSSDVTPSSSTGRRSASSSTGRRSTSNSTGRTTAPTYLGSSSWEDDEVREPRKELFQDPRSLLEVDDSGDMISEDGAVVSPMRRTTRR